MCSEIHQFSLFLRRMSGSDHPQIFPDQKKEETVDSKSLQPETAAEEREREKEKEKEKEKTQDAAADHQTESLEQLIKNEDEETDRATVSPRELSEDEDGFKTPTSSDHRIPVITQCPPAPMKLRPPPSKLKRKAASPPGTSPSIQLDEVESIFSPVASDQDEAQRHKIKKARAESSDDQ